MQPSDAEVRAGAVAKLKRATSLPRIKGGRRPPMHPEGASEGERSRDDASSRHGDDSSKNVTSDEREDERRTQGRQKTVHSEPGEPEQSEEHEQSDQQPSSLPPSSPKRKRRSRSRSRSRSGELKDIKPSKSPPPSESSPEAKLGFLPAFDDIPVASPTPSRPVGITAGTRLPFVPPGAPSSPTPGAVPTLQDLQQRLGAGLFRSQSASRAAAMLKLTGATSNLEPPQPSPSPKPTPMSRSNTVTGSERAVARQRMIGRLQHRVGNQADELTTSGGEEILPMPSKRRRRRSRRSSGTGSGAGGSVIVDDREPTSTSPNTPIVPTNNLPMHQYPESPHLSLPTLTAQARVPPPPLPPPPPSPPPEEEHNSKVSEAHSNPVALQQWTFELGPLRRDDVVIEDDEEPSTAESEHSIPQPSPIPPRTPPRDNSSGHVDINGDRIRAPHTSDAPSSTTVSSGDVVPVIMSSDTLGPNYQQDTFPKSPFNTPLKERPRDEEEEEEIVYREEMKARRVWNEKITNGNGIEWPGSYAAHDPVIAIQDEEEDSVDPSTQEQRSPVPSSHHDTRTAATPSPNGGGFYPSPSPSSGLALSRSTPTRESVDSSLGPSPALANFPNTTSIFPLRPESLTDIGTDYEEVQTDRETLSKRTTDGNEKTTWAKVKTFVARSGSVTGRRSRTNSTTRREEKTTNRESGASGTSGKVEHSSHGPPSTAPPSAWNSPAAAHAQLAQEHSRHLPMQTASASTSILSLSPVTPHRGGASPVPPASPADFTKYADAKLMPFPGLMKLDEERKKHRSRGMSVSASLSSPNLPRDVSDPVSDAPTANGATEIEIRERKLSHQYSDSGLLQKYRNPAFSTEGEPSLLTSIQTTTPNTSGSWLPMSRKDVRKWYKVNKFFTTSQSPTTPISPSMISPPIQDVRSDVEMGSGLGSNTAAQSKFKDRLMHKPSSESTTDFEESTSNTSATPKGSRRAARIVDHDTLDLPSDPFASPNGVTRVQSQQSSLSSSDSAYKRDSETDGDVASSGLQKPRPALSIIPEPGVSDRSWTPSASNTDSSLSYKQSPETPVQPPDRASVVFRRLDALLARDPNDHNAWGFLEDPPRKLIMSSSVTQVIDSDTIRERFLFLFNDILVVAKPLEATHKAMDRSFVVKSIIDLNTVQVITNRDECVSSPTRHPLVQQFVRDFGANAEKAVSNLLQGSGLDEDQGQLGKLLFNTFELDRTRLGGYLCKKSHKSVLKSYLDCFGFSGVRIDHALRTFLLSVRLPTESPEYAQEHLLNTFASKWFDANTRVVSFDKDVAMKLVRILVQLDNQIHKTPQNLSQLRDFHAEWEAIVRAVDPRGLISDGLIDDIYYSLRRDPLRWAADAQFGRIQYPIMFKRSPPNHLAYRVQSDPITLRIPHPDPHLQIQLHSQEGLTFDQPELNFARSTEVAFRVTGSSLGPKSIIFSLVGANASLYTGIPFSKTVVVERHFMRNTFQVAFSDQKGRRRRYMFSAEDALVCHQWALSLRQPRPTKQPQDPESDTIREVQKAAKALSLDILREAVTQKLSGHELIVICKQNSLLPAVLPNVTTLTSVP